MLGLLALASSWHGAPANPSLASNWRGVPASPPRRSADAPSMALPRCTIAVAGANGRVGSMVCRELLRQHPLVTVRALVHDASQAYEGYGRLSYEVGAEEGKMELKAAWRMDDETGGFASPASIEFDERQASYGLDRLEIRECELRYGKDVERDLADVDGVVWCATAFNAFRQRLPDRLDTAAGNIAQRGMSLFELRLGDAFFGRPGSEDGSDDARRAEARDKTADAEGVGLAAAALGRTRQRRATLAELTGGQAGGGAGLAVPFVLASGSGALGYDEDPLTNELRENEFGYRKRMGEEALTASGLSHVIVRAAALDDTFVAEGLPLRTEDGVGGAEAVARRKGAAKADAEGAVGVRASKEAKKRRIHPRDLATMLVRSLERGKPGTTVEAWTFAEGET